MKSTLRVLCLEDNEDDYLLITKVLQRSGLELSSTRVETKEAFIQELQGCKPQVILSDHSLPMFDSSQALMIAKKICPEVPFILVTGAVSDEFAVNSLKLGADDYVLKSNVARIPNVIQNALKQKEAEQAKQKAAKELSR